MKYLAAAATVFCFTGYAAHSNASSWDVLSEQSSLNFEYSQSGSPAQGHFETFTATINFDPDKLDHSAVTAEIDIASVNAGKSDLNDILLTAQWFNADQFPSATFKSTSFQKSGAADHYLIEGELTMAGITKAMSLEGSIIIEGDFADANLTTVINRQEFEVGKGDFDNEKAVGFAVPLTIQIKAQRQ